MGIQLPLWPIRGRGTTEESIAATEAAFSHGKVSTMRKLYLTLCGVVAFAGSAAAQDPHIQIVSPVPAAYPTYPPATHAASPVVPVAGSSIIRGNGCTNCDKPSLGTTFKMVTGGDCPFGHPCQNGCGSLKSNLAFAFGSCKNFFNPCGPTWGSGLFGNKCPKTPFAAPFGEGWHCPRQYDSFTNH